MKALKQLTLKRSKKQEKERKVLIGLIEHYLETGKPVGSNTLKEAGFADLSSATIRNYFAQLEEEGYLTQQHSSGGRIPTAKSFRFYANEFYDEKAVDDKDLEVLRKLKEHEGHEIAKFLREAAQNLSDLTSCAVFLSAPRFDNDYLIDIKVVAIDASRCMCILITNFGIIQTEVLYTDRKMSTFDAKRIEAYFHWRLTGKNKPENLEREEEALAQRFYNEVLVRHLANYSSFSQEDLFATGLSHLLGYPEMHELSMLTSVLSLFENQHGMRLLVRDCMKHNCMRYWIDEDLTPYSSASPNCAVLIYPYFISSTLAGGVGLLGPMRIPYRRFFGILRQFSDFITEALTKTVYKFKLSFREASPKAAFIEQGKHFLIGESKRMLLEEKTKENK